MSASGSYSYRPKTRAELQAIANKILERFPQRRRGFAVDIEAIIEDVGLELIFRPLTGVPLDAYVARDPRLVVVSQSRLHYLPRYRFTLAEELAHRILEFKLWKNDGELPQGARFHELSNQQHRAIERDAKALAAEILQPEDHYRSQYAIHAKRHEEDGLSGDALIKATTRDVAGDFEVSPHSAGFRAFKLGLIKKRQYELNFPILF